MSVTRGKAERTVHCHRGQTVRVKLRAGVEIEIVHFESGAVEARNAHTRNVLRVWGPKDRDA